MIKASFTVFFMHTVVQNLISSYAVIAKGSLSGSNMAEARSVCVVISRFNLPSEVFRGYRNTVLHTQ